MEVQPAVLKRQKEANTRLSSTTSAGATLNLVMSSWLPTVTAGVIGPFRPTPGDEYLLCRQAQSGSAPVIPLHLPGVKVRQSDYFGVIILVAFFTWI